MVSRFVFFVFTLLAWAGAAPLGAQGWAMVDTQGTGGAGAFVCGAADAPCLRITCEGGTALHYEIDLLGDTAAALPEEVAAKINVDGRPAGLLLFAPGAVADGRTTLTAPFDPRLHGSLIDLLRKGNRAEIALQTPEGEITAALSLRGSSRTLAAVMDTCPMPEVPVADPAAVVLDKIVRECGQIGGTVAMGPGFERHEDLDGDGREDVVIDYAAAVCSQMASLYCGSGGCTVGFFLARDKGFEPIYDGVIRGYSAQPGGLLALDLHGTACGLYGFEACRKVFRIADDSFALVEELAGEKAEAAMAADAAATAGPAAAGDLPDGDPEAKAPETEGTDAGADTAAAGDAAETQGAGSAGETKPAAKAPETDGTDAGAETKAAGDAAETQGAGSAGETKPAAEEAKTEDAAGAAPGGADMEGAGSADVAQDSETGGAAQAVSPMIKPVPPLLPVPALKPAPRLVPTGREWIGTGAAPVLPNPVLPNTGESPPEDAPVAADPGQ